METAEEQIARLAPGRTFLDVGCMWNAHGRYAFHALDSGATEAAGIDLMAPTPEFEAEQGRRPNRVRFIRGDLHDPHVLAQAGRAEVVFCSGVLYHSPNPLLTLERLREACLDTLILWTATIPEVPGISNGTVFFPHLPDRDRRLYSGRWTPARMAGLDDEFRREAGYANWFWGLTRSAVVSMCRSAGFEVQASGGQPFASSVIAKAR